MDDVKSFSLKKSKGGFLILNGGMLKLKHLNFDLSVMCRF
jgi:hypothetical protein